MDWILLVVGALLGVALHIAYQFAEQKWRLRRRRAHFAAVNTMWRRVEELHRGLTLVQAGWDEHGSFPRGSVVLRLAGRFELTDPQTKAIRGRHMSEWSADGLTNGETVGIRAITNIRTSDDPLDERAGRAHQLALDVHRYDYFDFQATHVKRLHGSAEEQSLLNALASSAGPDQPVAGFPTPCSVGLSVFCEDRAFLMLGRRPKQGGSGGWWQAGKIFNAAGEMVAVRDFAAAHRNPAETTPHVVAERALHEEVGFDDHDIADCQIRLHSFAWSSELLDFKFFGSVETSLSRADVQNRRRHAPDRESAGHQLEEWPVASTSDCRRLFTAIRDKPSDWSPEAIFGTIRSLLTLNLISAEDVIRALGG